jgi:hypothetical protein
MRSDDPRGTGSDADAVQFQPGFEATIETIAEDDSSIGRGRAAVRDREFKPNFPSARRERDSSRRKKVPNSARSSRMTLSCDRWRIKPHGSCGAERDQPPHND